jgi:NAD(P)-dependent dehydrogenase (short-subunit alcohol dehydrogenase family)/acyl carrier protein
MPVKDTGNITQPLRVSADSSYLITGGLGMLGIQLSKWLVSQGARHIVLTSRIGLPDRDAWSSVPSDTTLGKRISAIQALEEMGAQVIVVQADVADETAMRQLFAQFGTSLPVLQGVIHAAGVNTNQTVTELDLASWREVLKPKTAGAWILHRLTADLPLDFFVCFSSATSVWGSQGMAAYSAANHFLDQLAHYRHARQLPALTINWGWWAGEGIATSEQVRLFSAVGLAEMPVEKGISALIQLIETNTVQQTVAAVDWSIFKPIYESKRERPFLSRIKLKKSSVVSQPVSKAEDSSLRQKLQAVSQEKQREMLSEHVTQLVSEILGFTSSQSINPRHGFFKMGMDSLMTVQLRTRLEASVDCVLPATIAFEYPSITDLVNYLLEHVLQPTSKIATDLKIDPDTEGSKTTQALEDLSESELLNLLDNELSKIDDLTG